MLPQLRGEWHHEFEDDEPDTKASFLGDTTVSGGLFTVLGNNPDTDYFKLGAGVSATLAHGVSAFFDYQALVGYDDVTSHQFTLGGRLEF